MPLSTPIFNLPKSFLKACSYLTLSLWAEVESFASYEAMASSNAAQPNASRAKGPA